MASNLLRYKKDLDALIKQADTLDLAMIAEYSPALFDEEITGLGRKPEDVRKALPSFREGYQRWYSESLAVVSQLLPSRLSDFKSHYEKPKNRKSSDYENYRIEDALSGLTASRYGERIFGPEAAIPQFRQQRAILKSVESRFESSLFEIKQLVQADLLDSELDEADVLTKNGFIRAAGALAGVSLEKHVSQVCENHGVKLAKKDPTISDLNDALKTATTYDVPQWRAIQQLADIRNLCDHKKTDEPTLEQVKDLIAGVKKVVKTVF